MRGEKDAFARMVHDGRSGEAMRHDTEDPTFAWLCSFNVAAGLDRRTMKGVEAMKRYKIDDRHLYGLILLIGALYPSVEAAGQEARSIYLMFDSTIISQAENAVLRVTQVTKHPGNPLERWTHHVPWPMPEEYAMTHLTEGVEVPPWEKQSGVLNPNVIWDEDQQLYRMWYYARMYDEKLEGKQYEDAYASWLDDIEPQADIRTINLALCHMVSEDGVNWTRPALDVFTYKGEPTNIVLLGTQGGAGVFKDRQDPDPNRRYKLIARAWNRPARLGTAVSPDGIHWSEFEYASEVKADTHSNVFWAPDIRKYVGISREFDGRTKVRTVVRIESRDFVNWSKPEEVLRGPSDSQVYTLLPSYYAPGYYIGVMSIIKADGRVHAELAWSPDTRHWQRIDEGTPFIANGDAADAYDHGMIYVSAPLILDDEIRIYYAGLPEKHVKAWRTTSLNLATIGRDRFAGYEPEDAAQPGFITTEPFQLTGEAMTVTADVETGGALRVEVLDARGKPVPGFGLEDCDAVTDSVTDHPVTWGGADLAQLYRARVSFRFEIKDAKLFSMRGRMIQTSR